MKRIAILVAAFAVGVFAVEAFAGEVAHASQGGHSIVAQHYFQPVVVNEVWTTHTAISHGSRGGSAFGRWHARRATRLQARADRQRIRSLSRLSGGGSR